MSGELRADDTTVVVGAGIVGLAVAFELLRLGRPVTVLDRDRPGHGATWAAGGMLAPVSEAEFEAPALTRLALDSAARYPAWIESVTHISGGDCRYRAEGTLWVALRRDDREELERLAVTLGDQGLPVERLSASRLRQLEPHLSGRVLAGLSLTGDHQVDPRALVGALEQAVAALGGRVATGMHVRRLIQRGDAVCGVAGRRADGSPFELPAATVVLATGAWTSAEIDLPVALPDVRPVRGQLVRLRGERLLRRVVRTPEVYLIPRDDGELLIGATTEERGFDLQPTAGPVMDLLRLAWEVLPGCYELALAEVSVGLRSAVDDHLPRIGPTAVRGLFLAVGHYRNGILLAPATGHYLARWIADGAAPDALAEFTPTRAVIAHRPHPTGGS